MKYIFENLGFIDKGELTPGNLTIIIGRNNTGKAYINRTIHRFLETISLNGLGIIDKNNPIVNELISSEFSKLNLKEYEKSAYNVLQKYCDNYSNKLGEILYSIYSAFKGHCDYYSKKLDDILSSVDKDSFEDFIFRVKINNLEIDYDREIDVAVEKIKFKKWKDDIILTMYNQNREYESIDVITNNINRILTNFYFGNLFKKPFLITYERQGMFLLQKNCKAIAKKKSSILKDETDKGKKVLELWNKILAGKFEITHDRIVYIPNGENKRIPIYIGSSSVKSLLSFDLYLQYLAGKNDILLIDKPELHLHPDNQILMARFLVRLVNYGIDVVINTHSDFILKEINNLIMLSNDFKNKDSFMQEFKYENIDILEPEKIKAYYISVENHKLELIKIDNEGMDIEPLDVILGKLNEISERLYYNVIEDEL